MITRAEYKFLKKIKTEGSKWIARDKNWKLYRYSEMPRRCGTIWNFGGLPVNIREEHFTFIKWEDEEPTRITDLINEYESHKEVVGENENKTELIKKIEGILDDIGVSDYRLGECDEDTIWTISSITIREILSAIEKCSIEKEKQYILKFSNEQYLYNCDLGMTDESLACKLTKAEIEAVDPRLMQFAVEVQQ